MCTCVAAVRVCVTVILLACACMRAAGCVSDDGCSYSGAYPAAPHPPPPFRINKVAKIQRASIRFDYLLLLLLLYFTQRCEAFINLEI